MPTTKARGPPPRPLISVVTIWRGIRRSMIIELTRAHTPEDCGREERCGVCGEVFRTEIALAFTKSESWQDMGLTCPSCLAVLGEYKPEKFPTIEEYRAAMRRWDGPIWASIDKAADAEESEAYNAILAENTISRS